MRQNIELKQTLEKKNAEIAEFVELITNLNGKYVYMYVNVYLYKNYIHTFSFV